MCFLVFVRYLLVTKDRSEDRERREKTQKTPSQGEVLFYGLRVFKPRALWCCSEEGATRKVQDAVRFMRSETQGIEKRKR